MPPRAALVGNIQPDGRTCDLIVLCEGDDRNEQTKALTRQLWAGGNVMRFRGGVPYVEDDVTGQRHWTLR